MQYNKTKTYVYLVTKTCRNVDMNTLAYSDPGHCLTPLPNGMKFFETVSESRFYIHKKTKQKKVKIN